MSAGRGWYSRGYLPHIDIAETTQFLTWRLADSLPAQVLQNWKAELISRPEQEQKKELAARINAYCDAGHGSCILKNPVAARIAQDTLLYDHDRRFVLHAWVIMPNHVHVLLTPKLGVSLEAILRVQKSVTSTRIHQALGGAGRLWQPDYFDRFIRDEKHYTGVLHYIERNPVRAGLCSDPKAWPWSSANPANRLLE